MVLATAFSYLTSKCFLVLFFQLNTPIRACKNFITFRAYRSVFDVALALQQANRGFWSSMNFVLNELFSHQQEANSCNFYA